MNRLRIPILVLISCLVAAPGAFAAGEGDKAPAWRLPLLQAPGNVSLDDHGGEIVYVDFWASWCPPCLVSMPIMNAMRNRLQQEGIPFEVLAVDVDSDPEDGIDFLLDNPVDFPVLSDPDGTTPAAYGVKGMPTSYLVDATGTIVMVHQGFRRSDGDMIEKRIRELAETMP